MTKPIIVAVDPRREDVAPAALGAWLGQLLEAPVVLAATYPSDPRVDTTYPEYAHELALEAGAALDRLADQSGAAITTQAIPAAHSPARSLHELAEKRAAQLLVIGSSSRGPLGRAAPSAVTDRLIHGAPCPIAVAPTGFSRADVERSGTIGVAFTDTPDGTAALAFAEQLAAVSRARVRVLSVDEPLSPFMAGTFDALALDYARRARHEGAVAALERAAERLAHLPTVTTELLDGHAAEALAAVSGELDLLVCGSRGHGPVRTVLLGGTSHALVRSAACPVVVVPPGSDVRSAATGVLEPTPDRR